MGIMNKKRIGIIFALIFIITAGVWLWRSRESSVGASCKLKGTLQYADASTYRHEGDLLVYRGVDHESRLIFWKVTPQDDLRVGPNIFDRMPLPDGETMIFVTLPETPVAREYILTASISYGLLGNDGVLRDYTTQCKGKTTIKLAP